MSDKDKDGTQRGADETPSSTGEKPNLLSFTGGATPNVDAEALRSLMVGLPLVMQYQEVAAKMHWNKFQLLRKQGFNDAQALELSKTLP